MGGCQIHFTVSGTPHPETWGAGQGPLGGASRLPQAMAVPRCQQAGPAEPPDPSGDVPVALLALGDPHCHPPARWPLTSRPPTGTPETAAPCTTSTPTSPTSTSRRWSRWARSARTTTGQWLQQVPRGQDTLVMATSWPGHPGDGHPRAGTAGTGVPHISSLTATRNSQPWALVQGSPPSTR